MAATSVAVFAAGSSNSRRVLHGTMWCGSDGIGTGRAVTNTDGPDAALADGEATAVAAAVGEGLADGLTDGEAAGVVHATTSAPTNRHTADRITRQYAPDRQS